MDALGACLAVQRTYGKQGADLISIAKIFISDLNKYRALDIASAINEWRKQSPEFPTPSDIINILKARPPEQEVIEKNKFLGLQSRERSGQYINPQEKQFMDNYESRIANI